MDYSNLTDAEISAKLAENMGWTGAQWEALTSMGWSPCTSRDDLAVVVGHIRDERQKLEVLTSRLRGIGWFDADLLTCPPRIIAEACLEVMEG